MNNDGEGVRVWCCELCQSAPAIEGESYCAGCKEMESEPAQPEQTREEAAIADAVPAAPQASTASALPSPEAKP